MKKITILPILLISFLTSVAQVKWVNVDDVYQPLPAGMHVYKTEYSIDGEPNIAYYAEADLKNKSLVFTADTTTNRRITPTAFFEKNDHPLLVVKCTFFSFETNRSLNVVVKDGKVVAYNPKKVTIKKPDSTTQEVTTYRSAFGLTAKRKPDIAWIRTDSTKKYAEAS